LDDALERQVRDVLAGERFGVLATLFMGRLHTATIHFAETEALELVHAIRPVSLKAQLAAGNARVAFQVDNRAVLLESRERFTRIGFEGFLRAVGKDDPAYDEYRHVFAAKLPVGERLLANPEVGMYVLRPHVMRVAVGGEPPVDVAIGFPQHPAAEAVTEDGAWAAPPSDGQSAGATTDG
jgi:hypothetical protein